MSHAPAEPHRQSPPNAVATAPLRPIAGRGRRVSAALRHELGKILPPTIFFIVGFNVIVLTTNLILAQYFVTVSSFLLATAAALVVGKAVPVTNAMPVIRRYDRGPLIRPILFKVLVYWAAVFIARLLEHFVKFWLFEGHPLGTFLPHMVANFSWPRFAAIQIWILVLFLIYVTGTEFARLLGKGEVRRLLFSERPMELRQNRRQRIRSLLRLSRLADAYNVKELGDPASTAHAELVAILTQLAR